MHRCQKIDEELKSWFTSLMVRCPARVWGEGWDYRWGYVCDMRKGKYCETDSCVLYAAEKTNRMEKL